MLENSNLGTLLGDYALGRRSDGLELAGERLIALGEEPQLAHVHAVADRLLNKPNEGSQ